MELALSLGFGLLIFLIVVLYTPAFSNEKKEIKLRLETVSKMSKDDFIIDEELNKPLYERFIKPLLDGLIIRARKLLPQKNEQKLMSKQDDKLKSKLRQAGISLDSNEYRAIQLLSLTVAFFLILIISLITTRNMLNSFVFAILGLYLVFVIMRFRLASRVTVRKELMSRQLPDVLDMLSVSVEAGLGLEQAILQVINHYKGPLIDELSIAYREISLGRTRRDALLQLGERSGNEEVKSFCRAIVQAGEMGISVKSVLRAQAQMMRQTRKNKIEEKAMQVSVKILIPMAFFIFPVIFIVLLGPAVVSLMENLL